MKKLLTLLAFGVGIFTAGAQGFFEQVSYRGAFDLNTAANKNITLYGQTIKNYDGSPWVVSGGDWSAGWTNWDAQNTVYPGDPGFSGSYHLQTWSGDISSNQTWGSNDGSLTLVTISGAVHVLNGASLTIKPNTIIRGDPSNISFLLICKGAYLYAVGTPDKPIVFTSIKTPGNRAAGDWAGFLIMGKSWNNTGSDGTAATYGSGVRRFEALPSDPLSEYGGGVNYNVADSSGECRFLRVEFAGYNYLPDQEINGVTFGAVGNKTRFDFCQVSYSRDDSYEWFGGTNNHKYLIAFAGIDDDFDQDEGYQGKLQFIWGIRKPNVFETSAGGSSHGYEHDNNTGLGTASQNVTAVVNPQPSTRPIISNATIWGPHIGGLPNVTGNRFNAGMAFRTGDETINYNGIVTGYPRQWELFHPAANIVPSAHEKLLGGGDQLPAGYVPNEVKNTVLLLDPDNAFNLTTGISQKGYGVVPNGIVEQQQAPSLATFDPTTGYYLSGGTALGDVGFNQWLTIPGWNINFSNSISHATIFTQPVQTYPGVTGSGVPVATLKSSAPSYITSGADFTPTFLANNLLGAALPTFASNVSSLPQIFIQAGTTSTGYSFNVSASNLTGAGISISVNNPNFIVSPTTLPLTGGTVTVKYARSIAGTDNNVFITVSSGDSRVPSNLPIQVSGLAFAPAVPFVDASVSQLVPFNTNAWNTSSAIQTLSVSGNLLLGNVTVNAPVNFLISQDGSTFSSSLSFSPSFKKLNSTLVYVKYLPSTVGPNTLVYTLTSGATASGTDLGTITVTSLNANTELVTLNGSWGYTQLIGPLDATGNNILVDVNYNPPTFPTFYGFTGNPTPAQFTYISANNIPSGAVLKASVFNGSNTNLQISQDGVNYTATGTLTFAGVNGTLAPTKIFTRYTGTGSVITSPTIIVGLQGTTQYDTRIGFQGVTEVKPSATALVGTITGINANTVTSSGTYFTTALGIGYPLYASAANAASLLGIVTSIVNDTTVILDRTPLNTSLTGSPYSVSKTGNNFAINVLADKFQSNKDFNRGAITFRGVTLNSSTTANPTPWKSFTVSGINKKSLLVARDTTTYYSLYFELQTDTTQPGLDRLTLTSTGIINQVVYVRYNPTGPLTSEKVNGTQHGPELGQHSGFISVGGGLGGSGNSVILYLIGFSDPQLYASTSPLPSNPSAADVLNQVADLNVVTNIPSWGVPLYLWGKRLQSDVTLTSSDSRFEFATDAAFTTPVPQITVARNSQFSLNNQAVYVRFNTGTNTTAGAGVITVASNKISQGLNVAGEVSLAPTGFIVPNPTALTLSTAFGSGIITVTGDNLTSAITVTVPSNFQVKVGNGSYGSTGTISITSTNFGSANAIVTVTFTGTSTTTGKLGASAGNASNQYVTLTGVLTGIEDELIQSVTSLVIYPNPTTGDANLDLSLAKGSNVYISVNDITGTEISSVNTGSVSPGLYTYTFSNLKSGLYFITVITDGYKKTQKLVVY